MKRSFERWFEGVVDRFLGTGSTLEDSLMLMPAFPFALDPVEDAGPNVAVALPDAREVFGPGPSASDRRLREGRAPPREGTAAVPTGRSRSL